jgi:hypothetical protein
MGLHQNDEYNCFYFNYSTKAGKKPYQPYKPKPPYKGVKIPPH